MRLVWILQQFYKTAQRFAWTYMESFHKEEKMDNADLVVEHLTAEESSRGHRRIRHAGTFTLRTAKHTHVSCVNVFSEASQHVPWVPPHLCGCGWRRGCWGQSPPSSPRCEDGTSAQSGHALPSQPLSEPKHWAEQLGGSGPAGCSNANKEWFSVS